MHDTKDRTKDTKDRICFLNPSFGRHFGLINKPLILS